MTKAQTKAALDNAALVVAETMHMLENLAEFAVSGLDGKAMALHFEGLSPQQAIGDAMRERVIEAAAHLARVELNDPNIWRRHDWRDSIDGIVQRLNAGLRVTKRDVELIVRAT